jgi:hypothetical protein
MNRHGAPVAAPEKSHLAKKRHNKKPIFAASRGLSGESRPSWVPKKLTSDAFLCN